MDEHLVVIIGAGPAGSMAGHRMMMGDPDARILIVEKREEKGYKDYHRRCAEGISQKAFELTGAPKDECVKNIIRSAREEWPGNTVIEAEVDGLIVDRPKLLRWVRSKYDMAGGESLQGELIDIERKKDSFIIELADEKKISCRYLIGADGAHSSVRRILFNSTPEVMMPVEQYVVERDGREDEFVLRYGQGYHGKYWWKFPCSDLTKVGFPSGSEQVPEHYLERHGRVIPIGRVPRLVIGNAALIGDAAGQANPLTFGGLSASFHAGIMVAQAVMEGDLEKYEKAWSESEMANACFLETFHMLRNMNNDQLAKLVRPLRFGPNMTAIIDGLMNTDGFQTFYRSHVRKMSVGW